MMTTFTGTGRGRSVWQKNAPSGRGRSCKHSKLPKLLPLLKGIAAHPVLGYVSWYQSAVHLLSSGFAVEAATPIEAATIDERQCCYHSPQTAAVKSISCHNLSVA